MLFGAVVFIANMLDDLETAEMLRGLSENERRMFELQIDACEETGAGTLLMTNDFKLKNAVLEKCMESIHQGIAAARSGGGG